MEAEGWGYWHRNWFCLLPPKLQFSHFFRSNYCCCCCLCLSCWSRLVTQELAAVWIGLNWFCLLPPKFCLLPPKLHFPHFRPELLPASELLIPQLLLLAALAICQKRFPAAKHDSSVEIQGRYVRKLVWTRDARLAPRKTGCPAQQKAGFAPPAPWNLQNPRGAVGQNWLQIPLMALYITPTNYTFEPKKVGKYFHLTLCT